jgi:hypothetical protein
MRFAIAVGILAHTLPVVAADAEAPNKVHLTRAARKKRVHDRIISLSGGEKPQNDVQLSLIATPFLEKRLSQGRGGLKNSVPSKSVLECDPTYDGADVGILGCGMNQYCAESEDSTLGGFCMKSNTETDLKNRELQDFEFISPSYCDPQSSNYQYYECDCTNFDAVAFEGSFSCVLSEYQCISDGVCGSVSMAASRIPDGSGGIVEGAEYCYEFVTPKETSICYGIDTLPACSISVDNVNCNSCEVQDKVFNPIGFYAYSCYDFDCTNTAVGIEGNDCLGDSVLDLLFTDGNVTEVTPSPSSVSSSLEPASLEPTPALQDATPAPTSVPASIGPTPAPQEVVTPAPTSGQTPGGGEVLPTYTSSAPVAAIPPPVAPSSKPSQEPSAAIPDLSLSPTEEESSASTWSSQGVVSLCAASAAILAYYVAY